MKIKHIETIAIHGSMRAKKQKIVLLCRVLNYLPFTSMRKMDTEKEI
jgi:hypothetical protein